MPTRRILSLWFPHLAAERVLRLHRGAVLQPLAIVRQSGNALSLACLSPEASAEGLSIGQSLSDARAFCPNLLTVAENPLLEEAFLAGLRRWAVKYSPWVSEDSPSSLVLDITGCAHLFDGEEKLAEVLQQDLAVLRLTVLMGIADTPGAAWALARFAGQAATAHRSGDAIEQEARATRSRAFKRRNWERGGPAPTVHNGAGLCSTIAPVGETRTALSRLPVAALRLPQDVCANLNRMGVRIIADLVGLPRSSVARRFGQHVVQRLDQALGADPEPISPSRRSHHFATRLSFPDPIGLEKDILAGLDRLLVPLCDKLSKAGRGVRQVRLSCFRTDQTMQIVEVKLARPGHDPDRIHALLALRLPDVDAGFGIDMLRLEAVATEPLPDHQHKGHADAVAVAQAMSEGGNGMADLLSRLGARIGLENLIRLHPADSHIPEKTATRMAAAFSEPALDWPKNGQRRPMRLFPPELVTVPTDRGAAGSGPPQTFRWRRRNFDVANSTGPERISPEWWLDDPSWRSGTRDYWRVETKTGERLWLFETKPHGHSNGWFCQGSFG